MLPVPSDNAPIYISGPCPSMDGVHISGTDVLQLVTSPSTVLFNIIDDDIAFEAPEIYSLTLLPTDPTVIVQERMTNIIITNDTDSM